MAHNSSASPPPSTTAATEPICAACSILPEAHERRHAHLPTLGYSRLPMSASVFEVLACLVIVAAAGCSSRLADCFLVDSPWPRWPLRVLVRVQASCFFRVARLNGYCPVGEPDPVRFNLMAPSSDIRCEQQGIALFCIVLADVCVYPAGVGVIAWSLRLISTGWRIEVGDCATVGANSLVLRSVSANTTVLGVPAKVIFPPQQPTLSKPQSGFL